MILRPVAGQPQATVVESEPRPSDLGLMATLRPRMWKQAHLTMALVGVGLMGWAQFDAWLGTPGPPIRLSHSGHIWQPQATPKVDLGTFRVTAFCSCAICCGKWADGYTATGTFATEGRTIAVDRWAVPTLVCLVIEGIGIRWAEDTGSAIKGQRLDLFMDDHDRARDWGVKWLKATTCV